MKVRLRLSVHYRNGIVHLRRCEGWQQETEGFHSVYKVASCQPQGTRLMSRSVKSAESAGLELGTPVLGPELARVSVL